MKIKHHPSPSARPGSSLSRQLRALERWATSGHGSAGGGFEALEPRVLLSGALAASYGEAHAAYALQALVVALRPEAGGPADAEKNAQHAAPAPPVAQEGDLTFGGKAKASFTDSDGTVVKIRLHGPGQGIVHFPAGAASVPNILVGGTTANTSLVVTTRGGDGRASVNDLTVGDTADADDAGNLKALSARGLDAIGDVSVEGAVGKLALGDVVGGHEISLGGTTDSAKAVITLGDVTDTSLTSGAPIRLLTVGSWTDTDRGTNTDTLTAPSVGTIISAGDFGASLALSGEGRHAEAAVLGRFVSGGDLTGGVWRIGGGVGSITAESVGDAFTAVIDGPLGKLTTTGGGGDAGDFAGTLAAADLGRVHVRGDLVGAQLLAGVDPGEDLALGGGDDFTLPGSIAAIKVGGSVTGSTIAAGLDLGPDGLFGTEDDQVIGGEASAIGKFTVGGDLSDDNVIAAGRFTRGARVGGTAVDPGNDPRFDSDFSPVNPTVVDAPEGTFAQGTTSLEVLYSEVVRDDAFLPGVYALTIVGGDHDGQAVSIASVEKLNARTALITLASPLSENGYRLSIGDVTDLDGLSLAGATVFDFAVSANHPPTAPTIIEPLTDGELIDGADLHMEIDPPFVDEDQGQSRLNTDWEVWTTGANPERVWFAPAATGILAVHIHLGDGTFEGPLAGATRLDADTDYELRVRTRDDSGDAESDTSPVSTREFSTLPTEQPTAEGWVAQQPGYEIQEIPFTFPTGELGWRLPSNIAFVPESIHGPNPDDPLFYVAELYGSIRVVTNNFTVHTYATSLLNYNPEGPFGGTGENGLGDIEVDPETGDLYATMLYDDPTVNRVQHWPKVVHFTSDDGGITAATQTDILKMPGEEQPASHQISNISFGPDGLLYVHMGDGFDTTKGRDDFAFRGKILRMNKDGTPVTSNPMYDPADRGNDGLPDAEDYWYAKGLRNPFGGAWRDADGKHYTVENGPKTDRFSQLVGGRDYLYDGTDATMRNFNIAYSPTGSFENGAPDWNPAPAPVNITFVQDSNYDFSGFPDDKHGHAFVTLSGATHGQGPSATAKSIQEWVLDADGNRVPGTADAPNPRELISYEGPGYETAAGIAAGPGGLYFTTLYPDTDANPTAVGARILRVVYTGNVGGGAAASPPAAAAEPSPLIERLSGAKLRLASVD